MADNNRRAIAIPIAWVVIPLIAITMSMWYFAFVTWQEFQSLPAQPISATVNQATEIYNSTHVAFVALSDLALDCKHELTVGEEQVIPANDISGNVLVVIESSSMIYCRQNSEKPTGKFSPITEGRYNYLVGSGVNFQNKKPGEVWTLCTYCGRANSLLGLIPTTIIGLIGTYFSGKLTFRLLKHRSGIDRVNKA